MFFEIAISGVADGAEQAVPVLRDRIDTELVRATPAPPPVLRRHSGNCLKAFVSTRERLGRLPLLCAHGTPSQCKRSHTGRTGPKPCGGARLSDEGGSPDEEKDSRLRT
jgi:hypothetical protein